MTNTGSRYAFLVFIGCCSLSAGGFALVYDLAGVYLLPVADSLGLSSADVSLWLAADGTMALVAMPLAGHLLRKRNMHRYMTMGALATAAGVFGFRFCTAPRHFIICGCLTGFGMPYLYGIAEVTLISNWFSTRKQGRFLGIAMACQGIAGAIWAPLFTNIVQSIGYQHAYTINAAMILAMTLPWTLFVFRRDPQQMGLLPYGVESRDMETNVEEADAYIGVDYRSALKKGGFWVALVASCTVCIGMGFENHQQAIAIEFLGEVGIDPASAAVAGGYMMSCFGFGTVLGDLLFGVLLDKIPMRAVYFGFLVVFMGAFALWYTFQTVYVVLLLGSLMLGTHNGLASVGYPMLIRRLFGGLDYSRIYALVNMVCSFFGGYTTVLISLLYEGVGQSYAHVMPIAIVVAAVLMVLSQIAISLVGHYQWHDRQGNPVSAFQDSSRMR